MTVWVTILIRWDAVPFYVGRPERWAEVRRYYAQPREKESGQHPIFLLRYTSAVPLLTNFLICFSGLGQELIYYKQVLWLSRLQ